MFNKAGNEYSLLKLKIDKNGARLYVRHNKCGYKYWTYGDNFIRGCRCKKCTGVYSPTTKEYQDEVYNITHKNFRIDINKPHGKYVNSHIPVDMLCPKNHSFSMAPTNFRRRKYCPVCNKIKYKQKSRLKFVRKAHSLGYSLIDEYTGRYSKTRMVCPKGHCCKIKPQQFLDSHVRCKYCNGRMTLQMFIQKARNVNNKYTVLDRNFNDDIKQNTYINMLCPKGHRIKIIGYNFLYHHARCYKCYIQRITNKKALIFYNALNQEGYIHLEPYKNNCTRIKVYHKKCCNSFPISPKDYIFSGIRCPYCYGNYSKGELICKQYLDNKGLTNVLYLPISQMKNNTYQHGYIFQHDNSIGGRHLHLDFIIKIYNKLIGIEYNGEQHYKPIKYFGGKKRFNTQKSNDNRKIHYCMLNNILLVHVKYTHYYHNNIEDYLDKYLLPLIKSKELITN